VALDALGAPAPVESATHEQLASPVAVYNFQVAVYHTCHVGEAGILVHNADYNKKVAQLQANARQGKNFEQQIKTELQEKQSDLVEQITVKTNQGTKTRLDFVGIEGDTVVLTEAKSSAGARLADAQRTAFPEIEKGGATVLGRWKGEFPGGTKIQPTKVDIIRPDEG
jgi:membrane-bound inhibitor of C-type lysozyme